MWNEIEQALHQSAASVMTSVARLLPGTIALVVSVLLAAMIGVLLGSAIRRTLNGMDFDRRAAAWGWTDVPAWAGAAGPTALAARLATWFVIFFGFVVGLAAFDPMLTSELTFRLFGSALNLVIAVLLFIAGNVAARFVSRGILISLVNMNVQQARLISLAVKWLVLIFTTAMALDHLGIGGRIVQLAFGILFGGIVLTIALVVAIRSKELADWSLARPPDKGPDDGGPPLHHL